MDLNFEQLTAAALRLPFAARARLAEALITSLDFEDMGRGAAGQGIAGEIRVIQERVARLPVLDARSPDEILGYDDEGLPI